MYKKFHSRSCTMFHRSVCFPYMRCAIAAGSNPAVPVNQIKSAGKHVIYFLALFVFRYMKYVVQYIYSQSSLEFCYTHFCIIIISGHSSMAEWFRHSCTRLIRILDLQIVFIFLQFCMFCLLSMCMIVLQVQPLLSRFIPLSWLIFSLSSVIVSM